MLCQNRHLPDVVPHALVDEDVCEGGLGMTSLLHPYAQEQTSNLMRCLHDDGRLGNTMKQLLNKQVQMIHSTGLVSGMDAWQETHYCSIVRDLDVMQEENFHSVGPLEILLQGNPTDSVLKRLQAWIRSTNVRKLQRIAEPLRELGIWVFSQLAGEAGYCMIDAPAPASMSKMCSGFTTCHRQGVIRFAQRS